jgi:hypothetical protein
MIVCPVVLLFLNGCTDDEQAKMIERQKQIDANQRQEEPKQQEPEQSTADTSSSQTQASDPTPASDESQPTEEATPEPQTQTMYHFTSTTETRTVTCAKDGEIEACGVSFKECGKSGDDEYHCQTGVHFWTTEETVKE